MEPPRFVTVFPTARPSSLSRPRKIISMPSQSIYFTSILIFSSRLHLGLPSGRFLSELSTKSLYSFMFCHMHRPPHTPGFDHPQFVEDHDETPHRESFSAVYYCFFPGISTFLNWLFSNISYCLYLSVFNSTWKMIDEMPREVETFQRVVAGENKNEVPSLLLQLNYVHATLQTSLLLNDISRAKVKPLCAARSSEHGLGLARALYRCKLGSLT
jgi:hypothetical protein